MSLRDIVVSGVKLANDLTVDLHETVTHLAWTGQTTDGTPTYASIARKAAVRKQQRLVTSNGKQIVSSHTLTFPAPLTDTTSSDPVRYPRTNPIDPNDIFVLPDGTRGQVIPVDGFYDPITHRSYYSEVALA